MKLKNISDIILLAKEKPKKRLVVVYVNDNHTIEAVNEAVDNGIVEATLTGEKDKIIAICNRLNIDSNKFEIIDQSDPVEAGLTCCDMINQGKAHLIMKGTITSDDYMRCILNKERGIMEKGALLTHVTVVEPTGYNKVLIVGDVAVIPIPDVDQKEKILNFLIDTAHKLGNENPKVALISASEKVSKKIVSSTDAFELVERSKKGVFKQSLISGPMGLDLAIDEVAVKIKGFKSDVAGNADILLFPNIESGNVFYKTCTKFLKSELAALVVGAKVPAVLSSRGDSSKTKLYSIALAAITTNK
ncbi:MAG: phosphate acyltransferase [Candidatus Cloacimonetes bacterium]|jgi:phosphate butyryltransferase|nr:phosphate acyltransferase [Candidatus Cloacimonadota bacterium]MDD3386830.1 phosphate acyltransferase [Candidatus Paceibacterota bacterium]MDD4156239.1 phosphate acyltransferase [Candidatus Cloacimonadota bacterium]